MGGVIKLEDDVERMGRRIDFNKTDPEVIIGLVKDATAKGDKVQKENSTIRKIANDTYQKLSKMEKIISMKMMWIQI